MRYLTIYILLVVATLFVEASAAQQSAKAQPASTQCTFADGKEMSVRYEPSTVGKDDLRNGEVWTPDGSPMILFTQAPISMGKSEIPIGAYSVRFIPNEKEWTLIINKDVDANSKYDQQSDVGRAPMQVGSLGDPVKQVKVIFGHVAPKQCNMRIYCGKSGAWVEFKEK